MMITDDVMITALCLTRHCQLLLEAGRGRVLATPASVRLQRLASVAGPGSPALAIRHCTMGCQAHITNNISRNLSMRFQGFKGEY